MKTLRLAMLSGLLGLAVLVCGCVVHDHGHYGHRHHHGSGCGHELRGGIWVTVPVIEVH